MSFNWQQKGWPRVTCNRAALRDELKAFEAAFKALKKALGKSQDLEVVARTLTDEAVKTSAIEGVNVDESVVMSSICKALGVTYLPKGFTKDARAEGVAQMVLTVRETWAKPISAPLLKRYHADLMSGDSRPITIGDFRVHDEPMRVIRRHADGTVEIRYEAPPSSCVPKEIRTFVRMWKDMPTKPAEIALKAALLHPHFESIHPFEDGNGRVGRALVAKTIAEALGVPLILPVSTILMRHRTAYYDEINEASRTLDWTNWAAFFTPVLTEMMTSFVEAMRFVKAKRDYLAKFEGSFTERAKKVILRMFEDGEAGVRAGLSAAKWMRMTKVSKPTATRDLAELFAQGAIVPETLGGPETRYRLACVLNEPIEPLNEPIEGINEGINAQLVRLISRHPGVRIPYLKSVVGASTSTVERAIAALVKEGKVEHRGSKKTGGYYAAARQVKDEERGVTR